MMADALSRPPHFQNDKVPTSDEPASSASAAPVAVKAPAPTVTTVAALPQNRGY